MTAQHDFDSLARQLLDRSRTGIGASALLALILALMAATLIWAALTEIDDVTRADGRIVPEGQIQIIQSAEGGIVASLHVAEGDVVEAGAPLVDLDPGAARAGHDQEQRRLQALDVRILRLEAEIAAEEPAFPDLLRAAVPEVIRSETALMRARAEALAAEAAVLDGQARQSAEALVEAQAEAGTADITLDLLREEIAVVTPLVTARLEPQTTLLTLRRTEAETAGRGRRARAAIAREVAAGEEVEDRQKALTARFRAEAMGELSLASSERAELLPRLPALAERLARTRLLAPARAVVNRLHPTGAGAVIQPGAAVVELVPLDDLPRIEAWVRPADIAFLSTGQSVRIRLTAYDAARYGSLDGRILRIGADAVRRPDREETAFAVLIRAEGQMTDVEGRPFELIPGMTAEVDILNGRKTVLDYLIRPVVRVKERAFRD